MLGKNCLGRAAFGFSSNSFCYFIIISSSCSLYIVILGTLLYVIVFSLSIAAAFAILSASSFLLFPTWTLTHENTMFQLILFNFERLSLISSIRELWFRVFLMQSKATLLSVITAAVRWLLSSMLNDSRVSSAWLSQVAQLGYQSSFCPTYISFAWLAPYL